MNVDGSYQRGLYQKTTVTSFNTPAALGSSHPHDKSDILFLSRISDINPYLDKGTSWQTLKILILLLIQSESGAGSGG